MPSFLRSALGAFAATAFLVAPAWALDHVTLQLKWAHAFQFAGYYAAKELGYYEDAGLDVHIEDASPATDPLARVLHDEAQYGVGTSSLLLASSAGKPVVVLAVIFQHSPYALYVAKGRGIASVADLNGKRIMLEPQSEELLAYLNRSGVPAQGLQRLPHSFDPQDLISGKADAIAGYVSDQTFYFTRAGFDYLSFNPRLANIDFYGDNLFTSRQEIRDHPERVRAFRSASLRGWRYAKEHRDEVIDMILRKYSRQHSREYLVFQSEQLIPLLQPDLVEIGHSDPARWQHIANVFASAGMLPRKFIMSSFLYDENEEGDDWPYRSVGLALLAVLLVAAFAAYVYRFKRKLKHSVNELEVLHRHEQARNRILELLSSGAPLPDILDAIVKSVELEYPDSLCSILLMAKDGKHLNVGAAPSLPAFYKEAIDGLEIGPNVGSCGSTAYSGKRTIVENILTHPSWIPYKELAASAGLGSCWSEPIRSSKGKILGTFAIYHKLSHLPAPEDIQLIVRSAHLASLTIEKIHDAQELQYSHDLLAKISAEVPGIIFQFRMYPDGRTCFPFISEAVRKMYGLSPEELREDATPFFSYRHPEDAARLARSVEESARNLTRWHIEYRLTFPTIGTRWRMGDAQPEKLEDGSILWHGFITDITDRKNADERIRHMAQYDSLTDLPNRALFQDRLLLALAAAKREQSRLAILFIDLDKFKPINDNLGHAVGDVLLKRAALRMQSCMRESDTLARIGGDEFVVLLPAVDTEQDALIVAEKIRLSMAKPFEIEGHVLSVSTSIGISIYPEHGEDEIELSKKADLAMYHAKNTGRDTVKVYRQGMAQPG